MAELEGQHLPGKLNVWADFLSREMLPDPPPKPVALEGVKTRHLKERRAFALQGFGPGLRPDLWGRESISPQGGASSSSRPGPSGSGRADSQRPQADAISATSPQGLRTSFLRSWEVRDSFQ